LPLAAKICNPGGFVVQHDAEIRCGAAWDSVIVTAAGGKGDIMACVRMKTGFNEDESSPDQGGVCLFAPLQIAHFQYRHRWFGGDVFGLHHPISG
jgi:hypothetical protein